MANLFSVPLDGSGKRHFIANGRIAPEAPLYGRFENTEEGQGQLVTWAMNRFAEAVRAKQPELERLKTMQLYYGGRHWADANANRENAVRNFAFATVETVLPALSSGKPRPEIVLRRAYGQDEQIAEKLNDFAQWLMDRDEYDAACFLNDREMLKLGWSVYLTQPNDEGICYPLVYPVWDFYKDPAATTDDEMEYYFLARPVATDWLIDEFADPEARPWLFEPPTVEGGYGECLIKPDNIVSPGYDVLERPYLDAYASTGNRFFEPDNIVAAVARFESEPETRASASLVRIDSGERREGGRTSFLIQMFVRDRTSLWAHYTGQVCEFDDAAGAYNYAPSANPYRQKEPACPSGWRVIQFLADGKFLDSAPLDPCFGGRNIEISRDYHEGTRFYCAGEIDNVLPINRSINRRTTQLEHSLAYETVPVLVVDDGAGVDIESRSIEPGDVLRKRAGTDIKWLDFNGGSTQQFEMLGIEKSDLQFISGANESLRGERPVGIEAAAAVRQLAQNAASRVMAKETLHFITKGRLLKKCMVATAKKAKGPIWYRANDGALKSMDPAMLLYEYDIRFAEGTGTVPGRQAQEDKVMNLVGAGLMDQQSGLERIGIKGVGTIMNRLSAAAKAMQPEQPQSTAAQLISAVAAMVKADPSGVAFAQVQQALAAGGIKPQPRDPEMKHLAATKHMQAEEEAKPEPAPVIAGNGGGPNRPAGAR